MILGDNNKKARLSSTLASFSDCPNKCTNGYYIDPYQHRKKKCMYCEEKRKKLVNDEIQLEGTDNISSLLNLPKSYTGYGVFDLETVIPSSQQKLLKEESVASLSNILKDLFNSASIGVASEDSLLINLGLNAYPCNFIYAYLLRAYVGGATVSPYLTARDVFLLLENETEGIEEEIPGVVVKYKDLLDTDICVVHITTGANYTHVRSVKGLMQMRAHNNKSTIVFTDAWWFNTSSSVEQHLKYTLQSLYSDTVISKAVAKLVKVSYKTTSKSNNVKSFVEMTKGDLDDMLSSKSRL